MIIYYVCLKDNQLYKSMIKINGAKFDAKFDPISLYFYPALLRFDNLIINLYCMFWNFDIKFANVVIMKQILKGLSSYLLMALFQGVPQLVRNNL